MKKISNDKLESLSVKELKNRVSKSKQLRNDIAGFSKLDKSRLISAIDDVQNGKVVQKRKVGESAWKSALKEYNKGKDGFTIPRKGTKAHSEVKALTGKSSSTPATVKVPRGRKPKKAEVVLLGEGYRKC